MRSPGARRERRQRRRALRALLVSSCCASVSFQRCPSAATKAPVRKAVVRTADAVTGVVDDAASAVRGVGNATAATLGATIRLTGGLVRGVGYGLDSLGKAQMVERGPLAAPSRVYAGIYRVAGTVIAGVGSATVGLGSTVEGAAAEASRVAEDSVRIFGEPTRVIGKVFRRYGRSSDPRASEARGGRLRPGGDATGLARAEGEPTGPAPPPFFARSSPRRPRQFLERVFRRFLREAFENPSDRMVSLAPSLALALLAAWALGRGCGARERGRGGGEARPTEDCPQLEPTRTERLVKRARHVLQGVGLTMILLTVLRVDQEQQRHASIMQGLAHDTGVHESVGWLNAAMAAAWSPIIDEAAGWAPSNASDAGAGRRGRGGLGAELADYAALALEGSTEEGSNGDVLTVGVERVAFGDTPPFFGHVRAPSERTAALLLRELGRAREAARENHLRNETFDTHVVLLEADLGWAVDEGFEVVLRASAASAVQSSLAQRYLPQLRLRMANMVLGPAPVAFALEAAPQGYPYVGLVALTFVRAPDLDFSVAPLGAIGGTVTAVPLLREALTSSLIKCFPLAEEEETVVYDLGEYLAPGRRAAAAPLADRRVPDGRGEAAKERGGQRPPWGRRWASWLKHQGFEAHRQVKRQHEAIHEGTGRVLRGVRRALQESFEDLSVPDDDDGGGEGGGKGGGGGSGGREPAPAG